MSWSLAQGMRPLWVLLWRPEHHRLTLATNMATENRREKGHSICPDWRSLRVLRLYLCQFFLLLLISDFF